MQIAGRPSPSPHPPLWTTAYTRYCVLQPASATADYSQHPPLCATATENYIPHPPLRYSPHPPLCATASCATVRSRPSHPQPWRTIMSYSLYQMHPWAHRCPNPSTEKP